MSAEDLFILRCVFIFETKHIRLNRNTDKWTLGIDFKWIPVVRFKVGMSKLSRVPETCNCLAKWRLQSMASVPLGKPYERGSPLRSAFAFYSDPGHSSSQYRMMCPRRFGCLIAFP